MPTNYEVTYILRPNLEEDAVEAKITQFSEVLAGGGAEVGAIERMGKRRLAYEIDDLREGYYVVMQFKSSAAAAKELDRQLGLSEDVMRALLINTDA